MSEIGPLFIWDQTVDDGRFRCTVEGTGDYRGVLRVFGPGDPPEKLLEREVGLAYGARFGPDVADVADWQEWSIVAIDAWIADHG